MSTTINPGLALAELERRRAAEHAEVTRIYSESFQDLSRKLDHWKNGTGPDGPGGPVTQQDVALAIGDLVQAAIARAKAWDSWAAVTRALHARPPEEPASNVP